MKKRKLGNLMIIIGVLVLLFALINEFFFFLSNMDFTYLTGVGVVFLCCGAFLKNKKAL